MSASLRLIPAHQQAADSDRLYAVIRDLMLEHGFTEAHRVVNEQLERLSKAHRRDLLVEGWIA